MNWKLFSIGLLCTICSVSASSLVVKREAKCDEIKAEFTQCTRRAYADYTAKVKEGSDGKPDFMARKACNYMTAAVEDCAKILAPCYTEEELNKQKDEQLKQVLAQVQSSIKEWDTNKCPATKAHVERLKAAEEAEENPDKPSTGQQQREGDGEEGGETGDASTLTSSVLFALMLATLF